MTGGGESSRRGAIADAVAPLPGDKSGTAGGTAQCGKCGMCGSYVDKGILARVTLPCECTLHFECYLTQFFTLGISTCTRCVPVSGVFEDFGDCIVTDQLDLDAFKRDSIKAAMGERIANYNPSQIARDTIQMIQANKALSPKEKEAQYVNAASGVPVPIMRPWLPGTGQKPAVEAMLRAHAKPMELRRHGIDATVIINASITYDMLTKWHYTLKEMQLVGFGLDGLVAIGLRAAHLRDKVRTPVRDLVQVFLVNYATILDIESAHFEPVGVLISYALIKLDLEEHSVLGLTSFKQLKPYNLDRAVLVQFSDSLSFDDMIELDMTPEMLSKLGMLNEEGLMDLKVPNVETVRAWLPPGTKLRIDIEEEQRIEAERARAMEQPERVYSVQSSSSGGHGRYRSDGYMETHYDF